MLINKVDFVLVYEHPDYDPKVKEEKREEWENFRRRYFLSMKLESLDLEEERVGKHVFIKIYCPMDRLCQEAEAMRIELPLHGLKIDNLNKEKLSKINEIEQRLKRMFRTMKSQEGEDQLIAPFQKNWLSLFEDKTGNKGPVFWSSLRGILVYNILKNIDVSKPNENNTRSVRQGLAHLLMIGAYTDAFTLHDPSSKEPISMHPAYTDDHDERTEGETISLKTAVVPYHDLRRVLSHTWAALCKTQPIHIVRNYFGEKIAFYFAWVDLFIVSLYFPAFLGIMVTAYGIFTRLTESTDEENGGGLLYFVDIIRNSSDNILTPCFATVMCLWGTIFLEIWKRKQVSLAYEWHVEQFDIVEPDRPQYYGTRLTTDSISGNVYQYYPFWKRLLKYITSVTALLSMVILVFISVSSVILYRVYMTISYCHPEDGHCNLLHGTIISTILNTISIMILGQIYHRIAVKLTDWENHRTLSSYNDALIVKLFAFQFANTYTSLFYTAFFRRDFSHGTSGMFGIGAKYTDNCGRDQNNNCMSLLSFQLLIIMIVKPIPKFIHDVMIPLCKKCFLRCHVNEINDAQTDEGISTQHYLLREKQKPAAEDFRLSEFTEKMIQYGYLVLFAASFPLAPFVALIFNVFDRKVDAKRLLWWYKRPIPHRDNDIGIWFYIIHFLNICAVISNAFLIAYNSSFGRNEPLYIKFAIIIGFEHIVFFVKFVLSLTIQDIPTWVKNSQKRERFLISFLMRKWKEAQESTKTTDTSEERKTVKDVIVELQNQNDDSEPNNVFGTKREDLPNSTWHEENSF